MKGVMTKNSLRKKRQPKTKYMVLRHKSNKAKVAKPKLNKDAHVIKVTRPPEKRM